ncbi:MAG: hypothetical protein JST00_30165 [Deltaproteobacteria bacterium]|nr:hypothetical protein [Deltaproteobacteria bacterium]
MTKHRRKPRIAPLVVLASVSALVVACGGKTTLWGSDASSGAIATATPTPTTTSSPPGRPPRPPQDPPDEPPSGQCPTTTPIDFTSLPYQPPAVSLGACSKADADAVLAAAERGGDPRDWKQSIASPTCRSCVFGPYDGATWAPILEDGSGNPVALNVGGCMAVVSGIPGCGRAYQQWYDCRLEACVDCFDDRDYVRCVDDADKGACAKALATLAPSCGGQGALASASTTCFGNDVITGPIVAQCVGSVDGGPDGG